MERDIQRDEHSVVLYDVPRVFYGAFGGITPYPISLKACAGYLGEDIDYTDAITGCGAAFRLTWNTKCWDGGNVDVCHTYQENDPLKVYIQGITALGRSTRFMVRESSNSCVDSDNRKDSGNRDDIAAFIMKSLQNGVPVIATGVVGPPEAGLLTGYRDDCKTLLGWSVFQDWLDVDKDPCGYYVQDKWWENGIDVVLAMGDNAFEKIDVYSIVKCAVEVMQPRIDGMYKKGLAAYDEWIADISNDSNFPSPDDKMTDIAIEDKKHSDGTKHNPMEILSQRLMCHYDAADCLCDGRNNASQYFRRHSAENPLFAQIADAFSEVADCAGELYNILGGYQREEAQMRAIADNENRRRTAKLIKKAKLADERAFELLEQI